MRIYKIIFYQLLSVIFLLSCSGKDDDNEIIDIVLSADKSEIIADGNDSVTFQVLLSGDDVTDEAEILNISTNEVIKSSRFATSEAGIYRFCAMKNGVKSNVITVAAESGVAPVQCKRHMVVFKFTGTWCTFCPAAGNQIDYQLSKERYSNGKVLAFHGGADYEPMIIPETEYLFKTVFNFSGGYPTASIDMRDKAEATSMSEDVKAGLEKSIGEFPAYFSVIIESKVNENNTHADINVEVRSNVTDTYKVVVYVVEDGLIYEQKMQGYTDPEYKHNHVVRKLISKTVFGDSMGQIAAGSKGQKSYEVELSDKWNKENLSVYALIISEKTGFIHNLAYCKVIDGYMNSED